MKRGQAIQIIDDMINRTSGEENEALSRALKDMEDIDDERYIMLPKNPTNGQVFTKIFPGMVIVKDNTCKRMAIRNIGMSADIALEIWNAPFVREVYKKPVIIESENKNPIKVILEYYEMQKLARIQDCKGCIRFDGPRPYADNNIELTDQYWKEVK